MIDLSVKAIKEIAENLVSQDPDVQKLVLQAIRNEDGKGAYNSKGWVELDNRYNGLLPIAQNYNLVPVLIKRGCQIIALYNPSSNQLYLFLKKKTLREQLKKENSTYYVKVLNLFNQGFDKIVPREEQLNLLPEDKDSSKSELKELARKLLRDLKKDPSNVFVFSYDSHRLIPQVDAMAFNTNQEVIWSKNYSHLLDSNYQVDVQSDGVSSGIKESMTFTKRKSKEDKKQIVKLKSN